MLKSIKSSKKIVLGALALILISTLGGYYIRANNNSGQVMEKPEHIQEENPNSTPTPPEETKHSEENKETGTQNRHVTPEGQIRPDGKKAVKPVITYAEQRNDQVEVGGYVTGVVEDFGICKAVFQKGAEAMTSQVEAARGANSMDCPVMGAPANEFQQKGTWSVTVSYSSATASGDSDSRQLEIK